jgi:hypothetical protein
MARQRDRIENSESVASSDDFSSIAEVNRLAAALKLQANVSSRLLQLKAGWCTPDPSDRPRAVSSLRSIKTEAAQIVQLAEDLLALLPDEHGAEPIAASQRATPGRRDVFALIGSLPAGSRTKEDIDLQIARERSSWDER